MSPQPLHQSAEGRAKLQETARLYEAGLSIAKVSHALGVKKSTARQRLLSAGVELRPQVSPRLPMTDLILARASGVKLTQMAKQAGVSVSSISQRFSQVEATDCGAVLDLSAKQLMEYRHCLDTLRLSHPDALEIALEVQSEAA